MSGGAGMSSTSHPLFYVGERGIYKLGSFVCMQSNSGFAIVVCSNLQIKARSALFMPKLHAPRLCETYCITRYHFSVHR